MSFSFPKTPFKKYIKCFFAKCPLKRHENPEKIHEKHDKLFKIPCVQDAQKFEI